MKPPSELKSLAVVHAFCWVTSWVVIVWKYTTTLATFLNSNRIKICLTKRKNNMDASYIVKYLLNIYISLATVECNSVLKIEFVFWKGKIWNVKMAFTLNVKFLFLPLWWAILPEKLFFHTEPPWKWVKK